MQRVVDKLLFQESHKGFVNNHNIVTHKFALSTEIYLPQLIKCRLRSKHVNKLLVVVLRDVICRFTW